MDESGASAAIDEPQSWAGRLSEAQAVLADALAGFARRLQKVQLTAPTIEQVELLEDASEQLVLMTTALEEAAILPLEEDEEG